MGVVRGDCELDRIPVATGLDFGHTDPIWTLAQGVRVRVDPDVRTVAFLESGVA
jgi:muramoyltetrapeptide carboxypeptidase LdcA involved in peptidoglycan recycling